MKAGPWVMTDRRIMSPKLERRDGDRAVATVSSQHGIVRTVYNFWVLDGPGEECDSLEDGLAKADAALRAAGVDVDASPGDEMLLARRR